MNSSQQQGLKPQVPFVSKPRRRSFLERLKQNLAFTSPSPIVSLAQEEFFTESLTKNVRDMLRQGYSVSEVSKFTSQLLENNKQSSSSTLETTAEMEIDSNGNNSFTRRTEEMQISDSEFTPARRRKSFHASVNLSLAATPVVVQRRRRRNSCEAVIAGNSVNFKRRDDYYFPRATSEVPPPPPTFAFSNNLDTGVGMFFNVEEVPSKFQFQHSSIEIDSDQQALKRTLSLLNTASSIDLDVGSSNPDQKKTRI